MEKIKHICMILLSVILSFILFEILYYFTAQGIYHGNIPSFQFDYVDGTKIHYHEEGNGEPILLIHGYMSSLNFFDPIFKELSKNYRVIAVDMPGYGLSDKRPELIYTKEYTADLLVKFLHQKDIQAFYLLGHSMGGEVSLNIAHKYPNEVKKLILVNSTGYFETPKSKAPALLQKLAIGSFTLHSIVGNKNLYNKRKMYPSYLERIYCINSSTPKDTIYKINAHNDSGRLKSSIKHIKTPTLIIWGKEDEVVPSENGIFFSKDLPNNRLVIFKKTGHIPFFEYEKEFIYELTNFLRDYRK